MSSNFINDFMFSKHFRSRFRENKKENAQNIQRKPFKHYGRM